MNTCPEEDCCWMGCSTMTNNTDLAEPFGQRGNKELYHCFLCKNFNTKERFLIFSMVVEIAFLKLPHVYHKSVVLNWAQLSYSMTMVHQQRLNVSPNKVSHTSDSGHAKHTAYVAANDINKTGHDKKEFFALHCQNGDSLVMIPKFSQSFSTAFGSYLVRDMSYEIIHSLGNVAENLSTRWCL